MPAHTTSGTSESPIAPGTAAKGFPSADSGHVFILHCSVGGLAADAVLLPRNATQIGSGLQLLEGRLNRLGDRSERFEYEADVDANAYAEAARASQAALNDQLMEVVRAYLAAAPLEVVKAWQETGEPSRFKRGKPLIALPLPGAGDMDSLNVCESEGMLVMDTLPLCYHAASEHGVDVAVCTTSKPGYMAMQLMRDRCFPFSGGPYWMLTQEQREHVERLTKETMRGRISVFIGAGVSQSSNLPSWGDLLMNLAVDASFTAEERKELAKLSFLDQPTVIERKLGGAAPFRRAVARRIDGGNYTPAHAILGSIGSFTVTTNYDNLFEQA